MEPGSPPPNKSRPETPTCWNGIVIHPAIFDDNPTESLSGIHSLLDYCEVTFAEDGAIDQKSLSDLITANDPQRLLAFYDRQDSICDWYYAAYADPNDSNSPPNTIVKDALNLDVRGRVLVILDGPKEGKWMQNEEVDTLKLARTLWWYKQSGSDVTEVYGERELRRFVTTLYD